MSNSCASLAALLKRYVPAGGTLGLVGVGKFGSHLRQLAQEQDCTVLLCDPPRNFAEADDLSDSFFELWGNGMGGCQLTNIGLETFLPLRSLARADVIAIQVPLTTDSPWPTQGMITTEFLAQCRSDAVILCFSDHAVVAEDAVNDPHIHFFKDEI